MIKFDSNISTLSFCRFVNMRLMLLAVLPLCILGDGHSHLTSHRLDEKMFIRLNEKLLSKPPTSQIVANWLDYGRMKSTLGDEEIHQMVGKSKKHVVTESS